MDFQTSVRTCLTQKFMDFKGRASRSEYWWFVLAAVIGALVLSILGIRLLQILYSLAIFLPGAAAGARRLQDTGRQGFLIFIPMGLGLIGQIFFGGSVEIDATTGLPVEMPGMGTMMFMGLFGVVQLVILILFIYWLTRPSQPETNAYGPPPQS